MAGETPHSDAISRERALARRARLDPRKSADDVYYRSDQASAIHPDGDHPYGASSAATPPPSREAARRDRLDVRKSADTAYYRAAPVGLTTQEQARRSAVTARRPAGVRPLTAPPAAPRRDAATRGRAPDTYIVRVNADVIPAVSAACAALQRGSASVGILVADVKGLLMRVRTALDARVTREEITEDAYRDVRIAKLPAGEDGADSPGPEGGEYANRARADFERPADAFFGAPEPASGPARAIDEGDDVDPDAFLAGGAAAEEAADAAMVQADEPTPVDEHGAPIDAVAGPADDEDDDDGFLGGPPAPGAAADAPEARAPQGRNRRRRGQR